MANSYHQVYIQTIFAVKYRKALIAPEWKQELHSTIGNLITENDCQSIIVNGVEDHVHCFIGLNPKISISDLMKNVKAKSSKWVNDFSKTPTKFAWQEGYGVFSYSQSQIEAVCKYIENQEEHHKTQAFKDEFVNFLVKFNIPFYKEYIFNDLI